jgi:preprotein translocase subunit Sss1
LFKAPEVWGVNGDPLNRGNVDHDFLPAEYISRHIQENRTFIIKAKKPTTAEAIRALIVTAIGDEAIFLVGLKQCHCDGMQAVAHDAFHHCSGTFMTVGERFAFFRD